MFTNWKCNKFTQNFKQNRDCGYAVLNSIQLLNAKLMVWNELVKKTNA